MHVTNKQFALFFVCKTKSKEPVYNGDKFRHHKHRSDMFREKTDYKPILNAAFYGRNKPVYTEDAREVVRGGGLNTLVEKKKVKLFGYPFSVAC